MPARARITVLSIVIFIVFLVASCATPIKVEKVYEDTIHAGQPYDNVLVIGVAKSYQRRAEFERAVVSRLSERNVSARALHTINSGDDPIDGSAIADAVRTGQFDAVLLTRVLSGSTGVTVQSGLSTATATRRDDKAIDLFRYDYDVLNDPDIINIENSGVLLPELHSTAAERRIWVIESTVADRRDVSVIIDDIADLIVERLVRDGLIAR